MMIKLKFESCNASTQIAVLIGKRSLTPVNSKLNLAGTLCHVRRRQLKTSSLAMPSVAMLQLSIAKNTRDGDMP